MNIPLKERIAKIASRSVEIGLIVFAAGSPVSISLAQLGFISALVFWLVKIIASGKEQLKGTFIDVFLLMYLIGLALSSLFSMDPLKSLAGNRNVWLFSMLYLLVNNADLKTGLRFLNVLLVASILMGIYGVWQAVFGWDLSHMRKLEIYGKHIYGAVGGFGMHLTYGGYQMMIALILLAVCMYGLRTFKARIRAGLIVSAFLVNVSVIVSFARSAWLGLLAGYLVLGISALFTKPLRTLLAALLIVLLLSALFLSIPDMRYRGLLLVNDLKHSVRTELWTGALAMIRDHPLWGVGTGMFDRYFLKYKPYYKGAHGHPHNDFLAIYLRSGLTGFLGYMLLLLFYFKNMTSCAVRLYADEERRYHFSLLLGIISSVLAFCVAGLGQNYFTDSENAMLLWFLFGISFLIYRDWKEAGKPVPGSAS